MPPEIVKRIDATGLQCPGPIMRLKEEMDALAEGKGVSIAVADPGFPADVAGWCASTGNHLASLEPENGHYVATIVRRRPSGTAALGCAGSSGGTAALGCAETLAAPAGRQSISAKNKTIVVFSGDFDKAMAAFIIANGAAAMDSTVTMFFTFWGLNVLRRDNPPAVKKNLVERMFGWMMPRGAEKLKLSKMHMGGMGLGMIKGIMRKKNVQPLPALIARARAAGVKLVACTMSMDLMGIRKEELIDGVESGGVAAYLAAAEQGGVNLFIEFERAGFARWH